MTCCSGSASRLFWTGWKTLSAAWMGWSATLIGSCLTIAISCCLNCPTFSCLNCTTLCCLCCPTLSCLWISLLCWCCAALMAREGSLLRRRGSFERKNGRGATRASRQKGRRKNREIVWKKLFFFWTVLHIQILLGLTITEIIRDKLHMVLDLPRLATCGPRPKSSQYAILYRKIHQKKFYKTQSSQQVGFAVFSQQTNNCQAKKFI